MILAVVFHQLTEDPSMSKAGRSTFAVAISLLLLLSLPELAYAQQLVAYGSWDGYATYTQTDYGPNGRTDQRIFTGRGVGIDLGHLQ